MNLLVADDEAMIRKGVLRLDWSTVGIDEVYSVSNGEEAKALLLSENIDIGLFDISMPGASGLDLAKLIREDSMDTAVILLTGFSEFEYARDGIRYGVKEYLLKPVPPKELLAVVGRIARELKSEREAKAQIPQESSEEESGIEAHVKRFFSNQSEEMQQIIDEMMRRYDDSQLSLSKLAESAYISPETLSRKMKRETGFSYVTVINSIRLTYALALLEKGTKVSEILDKTGYNDRSYFSQLFRRTFGVSPSEAKKNIEEIKMPFYKVIELVDQKGKSAGE